MITFDVLQKTAVTRLYLTRRPKQLAHNYSRHGKSMIQALCTY
jgi:hypothetical protein